VTDKEHIALLRSGIASWNVWRLEHPNIKPDLSDAIFRGADLSYADLSGANLIRADLSGANLIRADLRGADLHRADLSGTDLYSANLREARLCEANLSGANLIKANLKGTDLQRANLNRVNLTDQDLSNKDLRGANLNGANLSKTILIGTNFAGATLTDCIIYGIAAWNVQLENAVQKNLIITQEHEATITIDNLKVAQFIYLMLNNKEIRDVINTLTTKSVLILGRFTPERKAVLDALRDALRVHNYLPILFDFEKPSSLDLTETVTTLAHLSRFIIIDLTDPSSAPHEAASIIPDCKVPIQPIIEGTGKPYAMFSGFQLYPWILKLYRYENKDVLITSLKEHIIEPAERKAEELEKLKNNK
jgi:hypothetical protein